MELARPLVGGCRRTLVVLVLLGAVLIGPAAGRAAALSGDFSCAPSCSVLVGTAVTFTATSDAGKPVYGWELSDHAPPVYVDATGPTASRTFDQPGKYTIGLRIEDTSDKQMVTVSHDVVVSDPVPGPPVTQSFDTYDLGSRLKSTPSGVSFPQGAIVIAPRHVAPSSFPSALAAPGRASHLKACFATPATTVSLKAGVDDKVAPPGGTWARLIAYDAQGKQITSSPDTEIAPSGTLSSLDTPVSVSDQAGRIACVDYRAGTGTISHNTGARLPFIDDLTTTFVLGVLTAPSVTIDSPADGTHVPFGTRAPEFLGGAVSTPNGMQNLCVVAGTDEPDWTHCFENLTLPGHETVHDGRYGLPLPILRLGSNTITVWVRDNHNREAHATISLILDTAPLRHYDLSVGAIEVTQAVQPMTLPDFGSSVSGPTPGISVSYRTGHYTGVLLASGKTTIARVFPDATGLPFGFHLDGRLYGYRVSDSPPFTFVSLPGNFVRPLGGPVAYNPDYAAVDRERVTGHNALTFNLPADWTSHPGVTIRLVAQLIPEPDSTTLAENSTENNIAGIDGVDFFPMQSVTFSPVEQFVHLTAPTPHDDRPPADPVPLFDATRAMLPVADSAFTVQAPYLASFGVTGVAGVGPFDPDQLLVQLLDSWYDGGRCGGAHCTGQPIAVIPGGGVPVDHSYTVPWPIVAPWASVVEADRPYTAIAHEIGHLLGRAHASGSCNAGGFLGVLAEGWPPDDRGYLQGIGVDPQAADMVGPGSYRIIAQGFDGQPHDYDYMSYCNGQSNGGDNCYEACSWVSPKGWTELFNSLDALHHPVPPLPHNAADRARPVPSLRVLAAVRPGGAVTIISVRPGKRVPGSPSPGKLFRLIGETRAGRRTTSVAMSQAYAHLDRHASVLMLTATVPARAVSKLAILSSGTVAATRSRPARTPQVGWRDLRSIATLPARGKVVLHWRAKARSGGPPLESLIEYSADGGARYRPIAATLSTSITVPAAMFARSSNARLRLRVNDGFDVISATSPRLTAAGSPPHVTIISPSAKSRSSRAATLELVGQAVDDELRTLKGRELRWYAGRRQIATGASASVANLPGATVVIRLAARDRSGRTASASVRIHLFTPLKVR